MTSAALQRGRQSRREKANEPTAQAVRDPDLGAAGHPRDHPLQMEKAWRLQAAETARC